MGEIAEVPGAEDKSGAPAELLGVPPTGETEDPEAAEVPVLVSRDP